MDKNVVALNLDQFERENFDVDNYVRRVATESIYASTIAETKERLNRISTQTAEEIKHSVYKNYANIMDTSKEVGHLEGKMNQLRQSLEEQRKLLGLFKNLNVNAMLNDQMAGANQAGSLKLKSMSASSSSSSVQNASLSLLLEQVEGCGLIGQKAGRALLYHSDLESLHLDDYSVSHRVHAYLLSDALLIALPQRKRNTKSVFAHRGSNVGLHGNGAAASASTGSSASSHLDQIHGQGSHLNNYLYKFQAFYELQDIKIINIEDSKEVRNSFQLLKFPKSLAFKCTNAHIKKEWLESIENAKKQLKLQMINHDESAKMGINEFGIIEEENEDYDEDNNGNLHSNKSSSKLSDLNNLKNFTDSERNKLLRDLFSEFDILLAQRDFEKTVEMLLKIKSSFSLSTTNTAAPQPANGAVANKPMLDSAQQLIYKQKELELINILRKDLMQSKERGNSKGVIKTGKRVVNSLIKLNIYDEAMDLFIDYHKYLNSETLKRIKLEESNNVYMTNVLSSFFDNLKLSYLSFREQFANLINYCYSTYLSWCDTEIEILIKKLQSQHYLGRHFDLTIENSELIFAKAKEFSDANSFDVKFLFETKLTPILDTSMKEQMAILVDASSQRYKLELEEHAANKANIEHTRQLHINNLIKDLEAKDLLKYFKKKGKDESTVTPSQVVADMLAKCSSATIQFARGLINFFHDCLRVYYQDINFTIVETFTKMFKAEMKIYINLMNRNSAGQKNGQNSSNSTKLNREEIYNNVCVVEKIIAIVRMLYLTRTGIDCKYFANLTDKYSKFKQDNF